MTTRMVRKQIYILKRQDEWLKRLAKVRGISEAEVIRQAIDNSTFTQNRHSYSFVQDEWQEFIDFIEERKKFPDSGEPVIWNRQEIYEERINKLMK